MTVRLKYRGSFPEVEIPSLGGLTCERGESIDVPDEEAKSLLEGGDWDKVTSKPAKPAGKE